ncbi:MAG: hypothetical protein WCK08_19985 [Betaproteobacteria bacterium]
MASLPSLTALPCLAALLLSACAQPMAPAGPAPVAPPPAFNPTPAALRPIDTQVVQRLKTSLATWQALRDSVSAYHYQVVFESYTGFRSVTTVQVRGHQVVERRLQTQAGRASGLTLQWVETGAELGRHPGAAAPMTLDQLYDLAMALLEAPLKPHEQFSLGIDSKGLLQHCYIADRRIADDAPKAGVPRLELELNPT